MINFIDNWHFHGLYRKYFKALHIFLRKLLDGNLVTVISTHEHQIGYSALAHLQGKRLSDSELVMER